MLKGRSGLLVGIIILAITLVNLPVHAQDGGSTSNNLAPINQDNASQVEELRVLGRGDVRDVAWSPDGQTIAIAGSLGLWLYAPDNLAAEPSRLAEETIVSAVAFSPDGTQIAFGTAEGELTIQEMASGEVVYAFAMPASESPLGNAIRHLAFAPAGERLAIGGADGVWLLNLTEGGDPELLNNSQPEVNDLAFSPDGSLLATAHGGVIALDEIYIWSLAAGVPYTVFALRGFRGLTTSVDFHPDGNLLLTTNGRGPARLWETDTWTQVAQLVPQTQAASFARFNPDGSQLATGNYDGSVRIMEPRQDSPARLLVGQLARVDHLAYHPDGTRLLSVAIDGQMVIHDLATSTVADSLHQHRHTVRDFAISPAGDSLAVTMQTPVFWLWDIENGDIRQTFRGHRADVWKVDFAPEGSVVASGGADLTEIYAEDHVVRLWDTSTGENLAMLDTWWRNESGIRYLDISQDGRWLATGPDILQVWDLEEQSIYAEFGEERTNVNVLLSADGRLVAASSFDTLSVWDLQAGAEAGSLFTLETPARITDFVFSHDNRSLAVGLDNGNVVIYNVVFENLPSRTFTTINRPETLAFSAGDDVLAIGGGGGLNPDIQLLSVEDGRVLAELNAHRSSVAHLDFSADGTMLVSSSWDGTMRIWGVGATD